MEQSEYLSPNDETWEKCSHPPLGLRGMPTGEMVPEFALTGVVDGIPVSCKAYQKELLELGVFIQPGT